LRSRKIKKIGLKTLITMRAKLFSIGIEMKILFLCVANSARSQIAEGIARQIFESGFDIRSAGSRPKTIHPIAVQVLREIEIDISENQSKSISELPEEFLNNLDFVITLCAEEVCPILPSRKAKKLHWPFPDPAEKQESDADQLERFRKVRNDIFIRLQELQKEILLRKNHPTP